MSSYQATNKNKCGITILEMTIALAVTGLITALAYQVFNSFKKESTLAFENTAQKVEEIMLDRMLRTSIINAHPSYNFLRFHDNNNRNFYDLQTNATCRVQCEREFTLSSNSNLKSFVILESQNDIISPQLYAPQFAYNISQNNTLTTAGTLNFSNINRVSSGQSRGYLDSIFQSKLNTPAEHSDRYKLITFASLVEISGVSGFPRKSTYLGRLDSNTFALTATNPENLFNVTHPRQSSIVFNDVNITAAGSQNFGVNGIDRFLRTLPPVGGVNAMALVSVVTLKRYFFEPGSPNKVYLQNWDNQHQRWTQPGILVGSGIESISFYRKTISSPVITINIKRNFKR